MPIATGLALGLGLAGAIGGSTIGAIGATSAAGTQANAANNAAGLQFQLGQEGLNFEQQVWNQQQANEAPFIAEGQGAVGTLGNLLGIQPTNTSTTTAPNALPSSTSTSLAPSMGSNLPGSSVPNPANPGTARLSPQSDIVQGRVTPGQLTPAQQAIANTNLQNTGQANGETNIGGINYNLPTGGGNSTGSLLQPWNVQFQAPTAASAENTPGYQFEIQQGEQTLQNSAAAQGNIFSGGTLKGLDQYANNMASTNYQQAYNNALTQYQQAYNQFQQNQGNTFNRLASLSGLGQTSTAQLGSAGSSAANTTANTLLNTGAQVGQNINNAAAATASGYTGAANAIGGGLSNVSNLLTLQSLLNGGGGNATPQAPLVV